LATQPHKRRSSRLLAIQDKDQTNGQVPDLYGFGVLLLGSSLGLVQGGSALW
jgi:hypothetical protein